MIENPVLTGFNPDPVMCYINDNFYIANSTFEYYPGISLSKSSDLANWEVVSYPLKHQKHMNLVGLKASRGIWAPCLSHYEGVSYLCYTEVREFVGENNCKNYITFTDDIDGDNWSEPVFVNSQGFDPSLFHDSDGKKYFISMEFGYQKEYNFTKYIGVFVTELDPKTLKPISSPRRIFNGEYIEGIHLYKKDNYYYLVGANGGTSYGHGALIGRAKNIYDEYEFMPEEYLVTTKNDSESYLQKAGHASLVEDKNGRWWTAFLVGRPLGLISGNERSTNENCPLGRETAIAEVEWVDGWPRLLGGGTVPSRYFEGYGEQKTLSPIDYKFTDKRFEKDFMSLRQPADYEVLENGSIRLFGKENIMSLHYQNMLVTRQKHFNFIATTCVINENKNSKVMGGMIYRYSESNQYYLQFTYSDELQSNILEIIAVINGEQTQPLLGSEIKISSDKVYLKLDVNMEVGKFSYALNDEGEYNEIEYVIDVNMLSDENEKPIGFTGACLGVVAQDLVYDYRHCDFEYFRYCGK